jgi:outer membrane protein TolC
MVATLVAYLLAATPPEALSFDEALTRAAQTAGPTGVSRAAETLRAVEARLSPLTSSPQLTLETGLRRGPPGTGADLRLGVGQAFNLSGHAEGRAASLRAETAALSAEARALLLSRQLAIAEAWLLLWAAEQGAEQAAHEVTLAETFRAAVEASASLGAATRLETSEASAYLAEARLAALDADGLVAGRWLALARLIGHTPSRPLHANGPLPQVDLPPAERLTALLTRAAELPEPLSQKLGAQAERTRAQELHAARGLQLHVGLSALREYDGARGGLATLTFSPPLFDRGERERGPLLANAARLEGAAREATTQATTLLAETLHELEHSREVLETLEQQLLPATQETARLKALLFKAGDATVPEVILARRALAAANIRLCQARAEAAWARVKTRLLIDALPGGSTP